MAIRRLRSCVAVRPEKITISRNAPNGEDRNVVKGIVRDLGYFGDQSLYRVRLQSGAVLQVSAQNLRALGEADRGVGRRSVSVVGSLQHDPVALMSDESSDPGPKSERWLRRTVHAAVPVAAGVLSRPVHDHPQDQLR